MSSHNVESFDGLLDFSQYEDAFQTSPSLSPASSTKSQLAQQPLSAVATPTMPSTSPPPSSMSGPSHQYELYKQQTGFVPGALSNTMALNTGLEGFGINNSMGYMAATDDFFDFSAASGELDMDFGTGNDFMFGTVNPTTIQQPSPAVTSPAVASPALTAATTSSVGRMYPGAHSALAKAQAQKQQQLMIQQQRQLAAKPKGKLPPTDPIVDHKISQILQGMRTKPPSDDPMSGTAVLPQPRMRKDEDDMDEDERLLASEAGKKLSSKERRQLRNKVSARAFRSRRKEYISQLENEITAKNALNNDLRSQNRALMEENKRLSDLTRMLLSSSAFSTFLDQMTSDSLAQAAAANAAKPEARQEQAQIPKDVNPFATQQQQGQLSVMMGADSNVDFTIDPSSGFGSFQQPQVFAVLETPETPIDATILSGKSSSSLEEIVYSSDKVEVPVIERPIFEEEVEAPSAPADAEFESDPSFALYHAQSATLVSEPAVDLSQVDLFEGINTEKFFPRYELVDATEQETTSAAAFERVKRISEDLDTVLDRIERLMQ
jgi:hypothetical protein